MLVSISYHNSAIEPNYIFIPPATAPLLPPTCWDHIFPLFTVVVDVFRLITFGVKKINQFIFGEVVIIIQSILSLFIRTPLLPPNPTIPIVLSRHLIRVLVVGMK